MNIKLFTHTDLDGVGCAILAQLAYPRSVMDIEYCDYSDINDIVYNFILSTTYKQYDKVYITDISINEAIAEGINKLDDNNFRLIDHHETAKWLNKYNWCNVQVNTPNGRLASGTSLFYNEIYELLPSYNKSIIKNVSEIIRRYDTWDWKRLNDDTPKQWNSLYGILGRYKFTEMVLSKIYHYRLDLNETELLLLEIEQERIDKYIESIEDNMSINRSIIPGYTIGIVFADRYISVLCDTLLENYSSLIDIIAVVDLNKRTVSYRTRNDHIHLGKDLASKYGGGGHARAAGSQLEEKIIDGIIDNIFPEITKNKD